MSRISTFRTLANLLLVGLIPATVPAAEHLPLFREPNISATELIELPAPVGRSPPADAVRVSSIPLGDDAIRRIDLSAVRRPDAEGYPERAMMVPDAPSTRDVAVAVTWEPPNQRHQPVYFEDVALERYGQTICPVAQPVISGTRFLVQAALLPYQMGSEAPRDVRYDVGLARPGSPTPAVRQLLPYSTRGLLYQGAASTGIGYFIHP